MELSLQNISYVVPGLAEISAGGACHQKVDLVRLMLLPCECIVLVQSNGILNPDTKTAFQWKSSFAEMMLLKSCLSNQSIAFSTNDAQTNCFVARLSVIHRFCMASEAACVRFKVVKITYNFDA